MLRKRLVNTNPGYVIVIESYNGFIWPKFILQPMRVDEPTLHMAIILGEEIHGVQIWTVGRPNFWTVCGNRRRTARKLKPL